MGDLLVLFLDLLNVLEISIFRFESPVDVMLDGLQSVLFTSGSLLLILLHLEL